MIMSMGCLVAIILAICLQVARIDNCVGILLACALSLDVLSATREWDVQVDRRRCHLRFLLLRLTRRRV